MTNNVAIIGIGQTKFGELWGKSLRDLAVEAGLAAISDSGIDRKQIEALYVGNMAGGHMVQQEHLASLLADNLGLAPIPSTRCEAACASGSLAVRQAYLAIKAGEYDVALVLGVEKMTDVKGDGALLGLMGAGDHEWETMQGLTFAGLYALLARAHMDKFGTTREQLASISVNNHKNGKNNPFAQFRNEISVKDVLEATMIADPLGVLDCSPITDGSAAIVLASEKFAKKMAKPVWIVESSQASDILALHDRPSLTEVMSIREVGKKLFSKTGLKNSDIDLLEVHDCFSINELLSLEDLGFCEKGGGGKFVESGAIALGGEIPTNTQGGLKSIGHPVGASGIRQIADVARVLRGDAFNQMSSARLGMTLNVGGIGGTAVGHILGKEPR
jgi:acetyl-CoA C-acetyltransferase